MQVRGRALYNLLRLSRSDTDPSVKKWQLEDYRLLESSALFARLHELKICVDLDGLLLFAEKVSSPEELLEYLVSTESNQQSAEQIYLLLFELWRRYLKEERPISVFCDELDYLIEKYDGGDPEVADDLYHELASLSDIFDESVTEEQSADEVYAFISSHLAHDLSSFLYDFIGDLIDNQNDEAASELIEGFIPYIPNPLGLEFLRLRVITADDAMDTQRMVTRFGDRIVEEGAGDVGVDFLSFLLHEGETMTFIELFPEILSVISAPHQLAKVLKVTQIYLSELDENHSHRALLNQLLEKKKRSIAAV